MTEQQDKARFRQAVDHTLSGLTGDPFLTQRVLAGAEKGAKPMKYHIPKGLVVALIALLCMGTVAVAAGVYGGTINWEGEIIYDDPQTGPIPSPTPWPVEGVTVDEEYEKALELAEQYAIKEARRLECMFLISELQEDGSCRPELEDDLRIEVATEAAFDALMAEAPWLPRPQYIPEGYTFERAEVYYTCAADGEWELVKSETIHDRIRVEWYKPSKPVATSYFLFYRESAEDYHYIDFYVDLTPTYEPGNAIFGFSEGMTAQVVTVPGMENAIAITSDTYCSLNMRRPLAQPLDVWYVQANGQYPQRLADVYIDITAPRMELDEIIPLFADE